MREFNTIEDCCSYLKDSSIFAGSLGSKELFHSNIWAYLIEQQPEFLKAFFSDYGGEAIKEGSVLREHHHMDLIIKTDKKLYLIENKIKSLPDKDQLDRYKDTVRTNTDFKNYKEAAKRFLLTGISEEPAFLDGWDFLNYYDIAKNIEGIINNLDITIDSEKQTELKLFALKYAEMLVAECELLNKTTEEIHNQLFFSKDKNNPNWWEQLENLRLGDIFQKRVFDSFKTYIKTRIKTVSNSCFECNTGYTHGLALVEFYCTKPILDKIHEKKEKKDGHFRIGVQIQESQFRWYIAVKTPFRLLKSAEVEELFKKLNKKGWFVDYTPSSKEKKINTPIGKKDLATSMRSDYCTFKGNNDFFYYQYFTLRREASNNFDFRLIGADVLEFMDIAMRLIEDQDIIQYLNNNF